MIGETIGHFKIVSRLGRGGMGEVYAGEHQGIQTRVAIKMLHAEISSDTEHVQRFFNEAKIVGKIKHAGIVKIFDVGFYQQHAYLIMELLEGEPLSARIDRSEKLPWRDAADLGRQIASVLDATHRAGVIHRDLKPDNIFVVPDHELDSGERIKILDFGISKLSGGTVTGSSPKTVGAIGTPAYMAPEQWGESSQVDWRADAYSLGCVLFEMACGRPPFVVQTIFEACGKHLHSQPPSPRSLVEDLPAELDELILRLLAKDPADRAVSMGQVARELEAIATGRDLASLPARTPRAASQPSPVREATPASSVASTPSIEAHSHPGVLPVAHASRPSPTMTTLGASAAELQATQRSKRPALIGGLFAGAVVIGLLVVVMTRRSDAPAPSEPTVAPEPVAALPDAAPIAVAPPDAMPVAITPPDAAPVASAPPDAMPVATVPKHVEHPPPHLLHPPTGAGSGTAKVTTLPPPPPPPPPPPNNGSDIGGRI